MRKWVGWDYIPRQPRLDIPAAGGEEHDLQTKALAFLKKEKGKSFTSEEIASAIGAPEEVEMLFKLLEHAAANMDHPIKKVPAKPPFLSQYQYHD